MIFFLLENIRLNLFPLNHSNFKKIHILYKTLTSIIKLHEFFQQIFVSEWKISFRKMKKMFWIRLSGGIFRTSKKAKCRVARKIGKELRSPVLYIQNAIKFIRSIETSSITTKSNSFSIDHLAKVCERKRLYCLEFFTQWLHFVGQSHWWNLLLYWEIPYRAKFSFRLNIFLLLKIMVYFEFYKKSHEEFTTSTPLFCVLWKINFFLCLLS